VRVFNTISAIAAAAASAMLLWAGFAPLDQPFFVWIGLVPLFLTIQGKNLLQGFLLSLLCGILFFLGIFNWILEVPGYTLLHHSFLAVYLGSYFGIFGLAFSLISKKRGPIFSLFAAPFIWVALEYVRSNLSFLALPWGLLAHSQYQVYFPIQIAAVTGTYGISFLIVIVNAGFAAIVEPILLRFGKNQDLILKPSRTKGRRWVVIAAVASITATLIYGYLKVSTPLSGPAVRVSVVQGNIEQKKKWDRNYASFIMQTYANLTQAASEADPSLIIWPETATPRAINRDPALYGQVKRLAQTYRKHLLLGSAQAQKYKRGKSKRAETLNSAFLISPDIGKVKNQRYDKIHLLPFGEYLPYKGTIPWSYVKIADIGNYAPGNEFTIFEIPQYRFGVTICWENIFPDLVRQFVKRGAQFIVNITNEAWFGKTAAPYQFVSMSVFRAVENRVFVVRSANTGISCIIDPMGRVVDRVKDESGQDIFVRGMLTGKIVPLESNTIYTRFGDWLAWICLMLSVVFLLIAGIKKIKRT
jgi:apolipoprotein N-acyltransferase